MPQNLTIPVATAALAVTTTLVTLGQYVATIVPHARRAIDGWRRHAEKIPDVELRHLALGKHHDEALNAEAAAVFSILAPRRARRELVELHVAFQLLYDYLDAVSEQPHPDPLANGHQLHQALLDALAPAGAAIIDPYARRAAAEHEYLPRLVDACRTRLWQLPAAAQVHAPLVAAARRCADAQSLTHAAMLTGRTDQLRGWAQHTDPEAMWWETAAGGISSLTIHALLAAAANPTTTDTVAAETAAAYASVCAFSTMLDSLVDAHEDDHTGNWSYVAAYPSPAAAALGMRTLADDAATQIATLPSRRRHRAILTGLAGFYLSDPAASAPTARPAATAVLAALSPAATATLLALRTRRRLS